MSVQTQTCVIPCMLWHLSVYDTALLTHPEMPARADVSVLSANASHDKREGHLPLQGFGVIVKDFTHIKIKQLGFN